MGGEHALRLEQAVDVVGRRLPADEDHRLAGLAELLRAAGVEHDLAGGGARRGVEPGRDHLDRAVGSIIGWSSWSSCAGSIRATASSRVIRPSADHVHRRLQRGGRRPLGGAGLEEVEPVVLDRELDVLHVAVVRLELAASSRAARRTPPAAAPPSRERLGRPDAGDDVLALRVDEELAERARLAGRRVARERDAGAGALALVAEHHLDDVHGGAEVVRDVVRAPVDLRARRVPRVEDGDDGARSAASFASCGNGAAGVLLVDLLERRRRDRRGRPRSARRPGRRRARVFSALELLLEAMRIDAVDGLAVHLDQAPVGVVGEARVAGRRRRGPPWPCR